MRQTLIIALMLSAIFSYGQSFLITPKESLPERDTVRVIMLCTDTTSHPITSSTDDFEIALKAVGFAFRVKGYVARERHWSGEGVLYAGDCSGCYGYYMKPMAFLYENKKPISPNIIVWQTK